MRKSCLQVILCTIALTLTSPIVNAATFSVLGGTFDIFDPGGGYVGGVTLTGNGVLVEGGFNGSASAIAGTDPTATYAGFATSPQFLGLPFEFYYAATGTDGLAHAAPTIDFNSLTADMGAMYANWNGNEFNVGGLATVAQTGPNMWDLSFTHIQLDQPFQSFTSVMHMQIGQVPVPAAVWLFGSGLLGLAGVSSRKKTA
jgi:hypothetical protein